MSDAQLDLDSINALRFLAVDMVQQAKSGHPGLPLGAAPMAYAAIAAHAICVAIVAWIFRTGYRLRN